MGGGQFGNEQGAFLDRVQVARTSAILGAAGADDTVPTAMRCAGADAFTLYFAYTNASNGGAFVTKIETSPEGTGTNWYQNAIFSPGVVAPGADTTSTLQQQHILYTSDVTTANKFSRGPFMIEGTVERLRVVCREAGVLTFPGTCEILARFA